MRTKITVVVDFLNFFMQSSECYMLSISITVYPLEIIQVHWVKHSYSTSESVLLSIAVFALDSSHNKFGLFVMLVLKVHTVAFLLFIMSS